MLNITTIKRSLLYLCTALFVSTPVKATFSILACDPSTQVCAAAVATNNLAVGSSVIYVKAGVGAVASQFETNPHYGPHGLQLLESGLDPKDALNQILSKDNNFDGGTLADRQVAIINLKGDSAQHSGENAVNSLWSGSLYGAHYAIQGNGLAGKGVLKAMETAFIQSQGALPERLMSALAAGQHAGGQTTGSLSAALQVKTPDGFPQDIDLRVDASNKPIDDLQRLLNFHYARQYIINAERKARNGQVAQSSVLAEKALILGMDWDRMWRRAAHLAMRLNNKDQAIERLRVFQSLNQTWFNLEIQQALYEPLHNHADFIALKEGVR